MKQTIEVLNAKKYDFKNDNGEQVSGTTLLCIYDNEVKQSDTVKGVNVVKFNCDVKMFDCLDQVPAKYVAEFEISPKADGNVKLKPVSLTPSK